jgi:hypothetical protein
MLKNLTRPCNCRTTVPVRAGILLAISAILFLLFQSACLFKKKSKAETVSTSSVRLALLPFNVPAENKDLRWAALAAPILMAKTAEQAKNLEIIPIWESMPIARDNAGSTRTITADSAANSANWLAAKWSVMGELIPGKSGVTIIIDFIPASNSLIPFRYLKTGKLESFGTGFYDAYNEFLRYLVAKPLDSNHGNVPNMAAMKSVAEALDREYGWFVEAEPGKAQEIVNELKHSDELLARSLFSADLYPALAPAKQKAN